VIVMTAESVRPDAGARWLDLVGTRANWAAPSSPGGMATDLLRDPAALAGWLADHGLATEAVPTAGEFALVRQVRAALRELAEARVRQRPSHPQALDTVNAALAKAARVPRPVVVPDPIEPGHLRRRLPDVDAALLLIIEEAVDTMAGRNAGHLHECKEPGCGTVFYDPTGRRRWCSGQACGTRARVRAHRERRKAAEIQAAEVQAVG
jgi:predicted RNA-binding Zn ribbon-like protein